MNLYNLLSTIKDLSAFEMVNSAFIGDVYEVNSSQDVEYPICVLTEGTHVGNTEEDTEVYNISLFLIDRLTEDESNELDIKSWANEGIKDIINRIEETNVGIVHNGWQINTFTQRFESLCAGAYATIQIETSGNECCGEIIKMVTSINGKTGDVYIPYIDKDIVNTVNGMTGNVTIDIPTVPTNVSEFNNDAGYITEEALTDYPKREETVNIDTFNEHVNNQTVTNNDVQNKIKDLQDNKANKTETVDLNTYNAHVTNQTNINNDFETDITELQTNKANKTETVNVNTFNEHVNTQSVINNDVNDKITNLQNNKADITGTVSISKFNEHVDNQTIIDHDIKTQILDLQNNKADKTELPDVSIYNPTDNFKTINGESIIGQGNINIQSGGDVTSVNGKTGDVVIDIPTNVSQLNNDAGYLTEHQDLSNYATKTELSEYNKTNNFKTVNNQSIIGTGNINIQGGSSAVTSVNGKTGDVVIDIPTNVSQLNNDAGYLTEHQDLSNYATKTELSEYNKTNNFKTVNNQSIIGTGNIEIQGGGGADKMDKQHPIFTESYNVDEINTEFRLSGYVDKIETQGTTNYNCVERWHTTDNLWVRWSLESINTYLTANTNTKFAAVKGFCLPNSEHVGACEYHLFIENTSTGLSEQIDQYMQDRHVYGDYFESKNITLYDNAIVDSRDPNDNIIGALNQAIGSTTTTCRFIRNGVTYYTPDNMSNTNVFLNDNYTLPYMTSIIDIKGILEHYSIDTYTSLRVQMKTTQLTHWHIMSCYLFFSNDTEFMKHSETSVDYVLIDELTQKATKTELNDYNKTNNFKTVNGQSIIGTGNIEIQVSSAVTSVNGQTGDVTIEVPTNVSQLNNDAGYLTEHQDLSNYATTEFVNNATNNGNIVWTGTQAEYDALSDKTVYLIYLIKK